MKTSALFQQDLIRQIQKGGQERNQAIQRIYNNKDLKASVNHLIKRLGGNLCDAQDMFQEAIIILDRNVRMGKYRNEGNILSYFLSICRLQWQNSRRKLSRISMTDKIDVFEKDTASSPEDKYILDERGQLLNALLNELSPRNREVLKLWQLSYSMKEIAQELGIVSEGMVRKIKCQAMKKLVRIIEENPAYSSLQKNTPLKSNIHPLQVDMRSMDDSAFSKGA